MKPNETEAHVMARTITDEDKALQNYPAEQVYLLHILAGTLCQNMEIDSEDLFYLLMTFAAGVGIVQQDAKTVANANKSLTQCEGDLGRLIYTLSQQIPQATSAIEGMLSHPLGAVH